jgi:NADPH-ferrihemoprotein reductase
MKADHVDKSQWWFGLMSSFLIQHMNSEFNQQNSLIRFSLQKSNFEEPSADNTNVFMVANSTGIAPFRAFLYNKQAEVQKNVPLKFGKMTLLFGCRHRDEDHIFNEELDDLGSQNVLTALFEAFSRDEVG